MDDETREKVELALNAIFPVALSVEVRDGVVFLQGAVVTDAEAMEAEKLAWRVPGVRQVVNELVVEPISVPLDQYSDEQESIVGEEDALEAVEDGEPYFPPTDPVVRPSSTSDEGLEIRGGWAPDSLEQSYTPHSHETGTHGDDEITEDVQTALKLDALTAELQIEVETVEGVVYLHGTAGSLDEAEYAESVAAGVPGVVEVVEDLQIE